MELIIESNKLKHQFGLNVVLNNLDLRVPSGVTGLVGANGAGKTTLISILLGLRQATSGSVKVLGHDTVDDGAVLRAKIGFSPEHNLLPDTMSAIDFVQHMAEVRGIPGSESSYLASDALWLVGLGEERERELGTMSTGQRQRAKIAQAIVAQPELVFLDEPTDGLDPFQRSQMLVLLSQLSADYSINVVLSSHVLDEVEQICDNVVALDNGNLIACAPIATLFAGKGSNIGKGSNVANSDFHGLTLELIDMPEDDMPEEIDDVCAPADLVTQILVQNGLDVRRGNGRDSAVSVLHIEGASYGEMCDRVRDAVAEAGSGIVRLEERKPTLEGLFLSSYQKAANDSSEDSQ